MWNFDIHRDGPNIIKYGNSHPFALQKIKILQRTQILKHGKIYIVHLRCIPIKLCKTSGNLHLFKVTGTLMPKDKKLNRNYLWDTLGINWDEIKLACNSNEIKLPKIITIKMQDVIRVRK